MSLFDLACCVITDEMTEKQMYEAIKKHPTFVDMRKPPIYKQIEQIYFEQRSLNKKKELTKSKRKIII